MAARWCASVLVVLGCLTVGDAVSVLDLISENPDLSEFLALVSSNTLMMTIMGQDEGTVFVPTNDAMANYTGVRNSQLLKYHMVNLALTRSQLLSERTRLTRLRGNQPLFVTSTQEGVTFVNNARIVSADQRAQSADHQLDQVLHIIDEVLQPTIPKQSRNSKLFNPTALELVSNAAKYPLEGNSVGKFYQKIQEEGKMDVFNARGNHTYFIPVDHDSFDAVRDRINGQVLDGHVIPNRVLFTRTMGTDSFRTIAFGDMLKVTIRLRTEPLSDGHQFHEVQSTTLLGDIVHPAGSVLSRLVRSNIAVKNGVVHLIQRPLMVMDSNLLQFIQEGARGRFQRFFALLQEYDTDFIEKLMTAAYVTLFVPSNQAFRDVDQQRLSEIEKSPEKLKSLLSLHLVRQMVTTESIRKSPQRQGVYSVESDAPGRQLYLSVREGPGLQPTLTVVGGGTNASVIVPDITLENGVVHVIDRILGVPYRSVLQRITEDPLTSSSGRLSAKSGFSEDLGDDGEQYTLLVPSNTAWQRLNVDLPRQRAKIFSGKASTQVRDVLRRHLITGHSYTMPQMARLTVDNGSVETTNGNVKVKHIPGSTDFLVQWGGIQARVSRPDEECTDGYIHVIDAVLMGPDDVTTSAAPVTSLSGAVMVLALYLLL